MFMIINEVDVYYEDTGTGFGLISMLPIEEIFRMFAMNADDAMNIIIAAAIGTAAMAGIRALIRRYCTPNVPIREETPEEKKKREEEERERDMKKEKKICERYKWMNKEQMYKEITQTQEWMKHFPPK